MLMEAEIPDDLKPLLFDGQLFYGRWGELFFVSKNCMTYADMPDSAWVRTTADNIYGRYFLYDIEPSWQRDSIMRDLYRYAKPWVTDLSGLNTDRLVNELINLFQRDELRVWRLTDGWAKPPVHVGGSEYVPASNTPAAGGSVVAVPTSTGKASKPKGGSSTITQPVAAKAAIHETGSPSSVTKNTELEKRVAELTLIGEDIRAHGYKPKTDNEILQAIASGDIGDERYLVSVQKRKSKDEPIGFRRPDTFRTTMWVSTFDLMKDKDLSAALLMTALGSEYEPNAEYDLYLLDQGSNHRTDGALVFVPTFDNMQKFGPNELHKDNPKDRIRDKELLKSVMTNDQQLKYRENIQLFWSQSEDRGWSEYQQMDINEFAAENFKSQQERDEFRARHLYRTQIGNNAWFTGNGATQFNLTASNAKHIEADGIKMNQPPGKLGVPELLTIQKNPPSIEQLEKQGCLKVIPIQGPGK